MLITTLQVALGGAIGAALRFLTGVGILRLIGPGFPVAVVGVNVFGWEGSRPFQLSHWKLSACSSVGQWGKPWPMW